jgi:hypothetical protein
VCVCVCVCVRVVLLVNVRVRSELSSHFLSLSLSLDSDCTYSKVIVHAIMCNVGGDAMWWGFSYTDLMLTGNRWRAVRVNHAHCAGTRRMQIMK